MKGLDIDAARPKGNHGPQHRIAGHADHDLARMWTNNHGLDHHPLQARLRTALFDQVHHLGIGTAHSGGIGQAQLHPTHIGFVANVLRIDLHDHREANLLRHEHGLGRITRNQGLRHRDMEGRQQGLRFDLAQHLAAMGQGALNNQQGPLDIGQGVA